MGKFADFFILALDIDIEYVLAKGGRDEDTAEVFGLGFEGLVRALADERDVLERITVSVTPGEGRSTDFPLLSWDVATGAFFEFDAGLVVVVELAHDGAHEFPDSAILDVAQKFACLDYSGIVPVDPEVLA